jgi:hypothetical protein
VQQQHRRHERGQVWGRVPRSVQRRQQLVRHLQASSSNKSANPMTNTCANTRELLPNAESFLDSPLQGLACGASSAAHTAPPSRIRLHSTRVYSPTCATVLTWPSMLMMVSSRFLYSPRLCRCAARPSRSYAPDTPTKPLRQDGCHSGAPPSTAWPVAACTAAKPPAE